MLQFNTIEDNMDISKEEYQEFILNNPVYQGIIGDSLNEQLKMMQQMPGFEHMSFDSIYQRTILNKDQIAKMNSNMDSYGNFLGFLSILPLSFTSWLLYRRRRLNYAEHLISFLFLHAQVNIIGLLFIFIKPVLPDIFWLEKLISHPFLIN